MRPQWQLARVREKRKEPPGRGSKQKELQSQPKYRSWLLEQWLSLPRSTTLGTEHKFQSQCELKFSFCWWQFWDCRTEWQLCSEERVGLSETGPSLDNVPESPEDLIKGTDMSSLSMPAQQHSANASSSWCFGATARKTQTSGQLLWGHIVPLTYLLPVSAFVGVDRIRPNGKDCVKINILPRDVKLSFGHLMGYGSRMPQSVGTQVTYST